jgi:hypothetical protein
MKKNQFRTSGHDLMPLADVSATGTTAGAPAPGAVPDGRLGVYDSTGQRVGYMGSKAGAPTASRFLKGARAKLGKVDGKDAWVATGPTSGRNSIRTPGAKHAAQLRTAKGSVTKHPSKPQTTARPKR